MVITIGREFGSGGKYIGEQLAKDLNLKFYDKEILQRLSKEENIDIKRLEETDESNKNSFWYTLAAASVPFDNANNFTDLPMIDQYFVETSRLIEKIAKEDNSVIIGRCSNVILRDCPNAIHVFVYASDEKFKIERKIEFAGMDEKKAIRMMQRKDKERAAYHHYYTNEKWGGRKGYDILLDTSKLGVNGAIALLKEYVQIKQEENRKKK